MKDYTYCLYLETPKGRETIVTGEKNPMRIHRISTGKSFSKRASKFGCSFTITRDNKPIKFGVFERECLNVWLELAEEQET